MDVAKIKDGLLATLTAKLPESLHNALTSFSSSFDDNLSQVDLQGGGYQVIVARQVFEDIFKSEVRAFRTHTKNLTDVMVAGIILAKIGVPHMATLIDKMLPSIIGAFVYESRLIHLKEKDSKHISRYANSRVLGNRKEPPYHDSSLFRGGGWIQITGRSNYTAIHQLFMRFISEIPNGDVIKPKIRTLEQFAYKVQHDAVIASYASWLYFVMKMDDMPIKEGESEIHYIMRLVGYPKEDKITDAGKVNGFDSVAPWLIISRRIFS
jgi:hypothetical protein